MIRVINLEYLSSSNVRNGYLMFFLYSYDILPSCSIFSIFFYMSIIYLLSSITFTLSRNLSVIAITSLLVIGISSLFLIAEQRDIIMEIFFLSFYRTAEFLIFEVALDPLLLKVPVSIWLSCALCSGILNEKNLRNLKRKSWKIKSV